MEIESKQQIIERRKEIEQELVELLQETESDFGLDDIKEIIYNEDGQGDLTRVISMFDTGQSVAELQNVPELVNDSWNYFPHKILGGLSPSIAIEGKSGDNCILYYGGEIENPDWDGLLLSVCKVPTKLGIVNFSKGNFGVDMSPITKYCLSSGGPI